MREKEATLDKEKGASVEAKRAEEIAQALMKKEEDVVAGVVSEEFMEPNRKPRHMWDATEQHLLDELRLITAPVLMAPVEKRLFKRCFEYDCACDAIVQEEAL